MTQKVEQLFVEAKEFLLKHSTVFTSRNLDDVEYVAHYMAKFADAALASHAPSEAAAQPKEPMELTHPRYDKVYMDAMKKLAEIEHNDH